MCRSGVWRSSLGVLATILLTLTVATGLASAQNCTVTGNSVTCAGGPGASVTIPSNNTFTLPHTVTGSPYPSTLFVSGAPAGATVSYLTLTLNGYNAIGPMAGGGNSADVGILLGDGSHNLQIMRCAGMGGAGSSQTSLNLTLQDGGTAIPACTGSTDWTVTGNQTYGPSTYDGTGRDSEASPNYGIAIQNSADILGSGSLGHPVSAGVFTGDAVNGSWNLYLVDDGISFGAGISFTSWSITIFYNAASTPSATTLTPSSPTVFASSPNNIVTLTATVPSGATGTVLFQEGANNLTCFGGNPATLDRNTAACVTTFSDEGVHALTAEYSGDSTFVASDGTANVFIQNHAPNEGILYCNTGRITNSGGSASAYTSTTPYPSVIFVGDGVNTDITNSVSTVSVQLRSLSSAGTNDTHFLLVAPDGVHAFDFWSDVTYIGFGDYTLQDGSPQLFSNGLSAGTFGPTAYSLNSTTGDNFLPGPPWPAPQVPASFSVAAPAGGATFETAIGGAPSAHGAWSLFAWSSATGTTTTIDGWCLLITPASGTSPTTSVSSNPRRAALGKPVTFTATVGGGVAGLGTVTFTENGSPLTGAPNGGVANLFAGVATIATSLLPEGDHNITATYHPGSSGFNWSFGTTAMRVDQATSAPTLEGSTWEYCNTSYITIPAGTVSISDIGPAQPNPSNIFVSNLPGTISSVSLTFDGLQLPGGGSILESLLVGPNGGNAPTSAQTLDFFSLVGNNAAFGPQNTTFEDASSPPPCSTTSSAPLPDDAPASCGATSYMASQFYTLPSSVQRAVPGGNFTFNTGAFSGTGGGVYLDTNPNGAWSLYFNQVAHITGGGVSGWCMNFTQNPVSVSVTTSHTGSFTLGQQAAQFNIVVTNNDAAGSTGDPDGNHPLIVTDVLASDFTPGASLPSGTPWSCSAAGQTVTCVSETAVGPGNSYPTLTIPANVSATAAASDSNSVLVSGGGASLTSSNTDIVTIAPNRPNPPSIVSGFNPSSVALSGTAALTFTITNPASNIVALTGVGFTDTLPSGLLVTTPNGLSNTCGGTAAANSGSGSVTLSGASVAANRSCTVSVNISATQSGVFQNTTSVIDSANGGAGNSTSATLTVTAPPPPLAPPPPAPLNLRVRPSSLSFSYSIGQIPAAQSQSIAVSASATFRLAVTVAPGASWLSASVLLNSVTATVNATGLAAGTYQASLLLSISLASQPVTVPVTLTVSAPPAVLAISAPSLSLTATAAATGAQATPVTQSMQLSAQNQNVSFSVSTATPWLTVSGNPSNTPASLAITANPGTLAVGRYTGSFQIAAPEASNSPLTVPVTLNVVSSLVVHSGIFENSASFLAIPGAANAIMAVFGSLGCPVAPTVLVNGSEAPLIGVTPSMVTFPLPPSVDGANSASIVVKCNGVQTASAPLPLAPVSPGIYTLSMTGAGQGAVVNQAGTVNGASHPAPRNTYLEIYATGFGAYLAPSPDGLQRLSHTVQALIGGMPAQVEFAGHAPDSTLGLQQINVLIPVNAPTGPNVPIQLTVDGASTQPGVTVVIE